MRARRSSAASSSASSAARRRMRRPSCAARSPLRPPRAATDATSLPRSRRGRSASACLVAERAPLVEARDCAWTGDGESPSFRMKAADGEAVQDARDDFDGLVSIAAHVKGKILADLVIAHIQLDRPTVLLDQPPGRIGKVRSWNDALDLGNDRGSSAKRLRLE